MHSRPLLGILGFCALLLTAAALRGQSLAYPEAELASSQLPLQPTRTLQFTTEEGTWMSLAVSADGKTIVFDLLGDLYTLPIGGGTATRITSGMTWDAHPAFSPDGTLIAFVSDRDGSDNLWVVRPDGSNLRQISREERWLHGSPGWSADGQYLTARKWGVFSGPDDMLHRVQLWLYHLDGGRGFPLADGRDGTLISSGASFARDGQTIYFSSRATPIGAGPAADGLGQYQVKAMDRATGEIAALTSEFGGGLRPIVSPDGRYLVYATREDAKTGLRIRTLATDEERWLAYPVQRDNQEGFGSDDIFPGYTFTPDSRSVIFTADGKIKRVDVQTRAVAMIPFVAQVEQQLAPLVRFEYPVADDQVAATQIRWAQPFPNGKQVVFGAFARLWVANADGSKPRRLTTHQGMEYHPSISADGKWIAYVTWTDTEGGHLWKIPAQGGKPVRLTSRPAYYAHPSWSADGKKIVLIKAPHLAYDSWAQASRYELAWIDARGGEPHKIIPYGRSAQRATFSADGARIYYVQDGSPIEGTPDKSQALHSVRLDGTDKRTHARFRGYDGDIVPSPDGRWIVFAHEDNLFLTPMPPVERADPLLIDPDGAVTALWVLSKEGGNHPTWTADGRGLMWSWGTHLFSSSLDEVTRAKTEAEVEAWRPRDVTLSVSLPRARPSGQVLLQGARLITMRAEEVIEKGDILIDGNRIAALGPSGTLTAPATATKIDVSGKTIVPGFVDNHAHLQGSGDITPQYPADFVNSLAYGVTTARDPTGVVRGLALRDLIDVGEVLGPRHHFIGRTLVPDGVEIASAEEAEHVAKRYRSGGATSLKQYLHPRRIQRQWLIAAAAKEGINVTAEGSGDLKYDLTMVLDGYTSIEHNIPVEMYHDVVQLIAGSGTGNNPTFMTHMGAPMGETFFRTNEMHDDPKIARFTPHYRLDQNSRRRETLMPEEYHFPAIARGLRDIVRAGGRVGLGSHGNQQGIGIQWELWMMASGGMTPMEMLKTATILPAQMIGMDRQLASLEPGKLADLLVLDANPLENIRNTNTLRYVMKDGKLYDADTMNEVWPEKKPLPPFYWAKWKSDRDSLPKH